MSINCNYATSLEDRLTNHRLLQEICLFSAVSVSFSLQELISGSDAYVNGEVKKSSHSLHCDSGVIFGHYSDVLEEKGTISLIYKSTA